MSPTYRTRFRTIPSPSPGIIKIGTLKWVQDTPSGSNPDLYYGRVVTLGNVNVSTGGYPSFMEQTYDRLNGRPPYLTGGTFGSIKAHMPDYAVKGNGHYEGPLFDNRFPQPGGVLGHIVYDGGFSQPNFFGDSVALGTYADPGLIQGNAALYPSLSSLASGAYARLRPRIEGAGLGVATGELSDFPRMMRTTAGIFHQTWRDMGGITTSDRMVPKEIGDQYLNTQFGWVPFLNDIGKMISLTNDLHAHISQVRRDNGKWVKKIRRNQTIESETSLGSNPGSRCQPTTGEALALFASPPTSQLLLRESTSVWYEGVFKYYRPEFEDSSFGGPSSIPLPFPTGITPRGNLTGSVEWTSLSELRRLSTVYGVRLNPSVVWKLTPWSWLVDWFSNVGDVIQRSTDAAYDGVVSKYMYLMHHHIREVILRQYLPLHGGAKTLEWSRIIDIKRRVAADSPYGFSLDAGTLSPYQLAILAALGLSRSQS